MPIYDYKCPQCGEEIEVRLKLNELNTVVLCPKCEDEHGVIMERQCGNNGGFRLKGHCWADDGYSRFYGDAMKFKGKR